jgi:hypothetical protein
MILGDSLPIMVSLAEKEGLTLNRVSWLSRSGSRAVSSASKRSIVRPAKTDAALDPRISLLMHSCRKIDQTPVSVADKLVTRLAVVRPTPDMRRGRV